MYPSDYLYSREHEWVRVMDDVCVLGITEFAQQELGVAAIVELLSDRQEFHAHDELVEINDAVVDDPEMLNDDPHGEGWLVKSRFSSADDLKALMKAEAYEEFIKSGEA